MAPEHAPDRDFITSKHRQNLPRGVFTPCVWNCHCAPRFSGKPYDSDRELKVALCVFPVFIWACEFQSAVAHGMKRCSGTWMYGVHASGDGSIAAVLWHRQ